MIPAGYMYKFVSQHPAWLESAEQVEEVCALSGCISNEFTDYVSAWRHNGFWLFDQPATMREIAHERGVDLSAARLFFYEYYDLQFGDEAKAWSPVAPDDAFPTDVKPPSERTLRGFDVVSFYAGNMPECSPLSCQRLASEIPVNAHCLFATFDEAKAALEAGRFHHSEPGPYRIAAVYEVGRDA